MIPYEIFPSMITVGWTVLLQNLSHNNNHNHNRVSISGFLPHSQHWFHWPSYLEHGGTRRGLSSTRWIHHATKSLCYWRYLGLPVGSAGWFTTKLQQCQHVRTMPILSSFSKLITCFRMPPIILTPSTEKPDSSLYPCPVFRTPERSGKENLAMVLELPITGTVDLWIERGVALCIQKMCN